MAEDEAMEAEDEKEESSNDKDNTPDEIEKENVSTVYNFTKCIPDVEDWTWRLKPSEK